MQALWGLIWAAARQVDHLGLPMYALGNLVIDLAVLELGWLPPSFDFGTLEVDKSKGPLLVLPQARSITFRFHNGEGASLLEVLHLSLA